LRIADVPKIDKNMNITTVPNLSSIEL